jgi:membrane dipeptidase
MVGRGTKLTRRRAIAVVAGMSVWGCRRSAAAGNSTYTDTQYARATIIDALGGPGGFDPALPDDAPLSPAFVADALASGITAVNLTVGEVGNAPDCFEKTIAEIAAAEHELNSHPDVFVKILRASDLAHAKTTKRLGLIFGFEDSSMLGSNLKRLEQFYDLGVRICQPTYNRRNLMGDGCLEPNDGGLSRLGQELVAEMNRLHMVLDLSHGGPRTVAEAIAASKAPAIISHTGCRALVDLPRNTRDDELKALANRGGVAGIYFMPFLRKSGQPHAEDLIRHLEHAVNACGEDHVGIGTDGGISRIELNKAYSDQMRKFYEDRSKRGLAAPGEAPDVFNLIPEYNSPSRFRTLAGDLSRRGWPSARIDKILGANFARVFGSVWSSVGGGGDGKGGH